MSRSTRYAVDRAGASEVEVVGELLPGRRDSDSTVASPWGSFADHCMSCITARAGLSATFASSARSYPTHRERPLEEQ